jgi:hypothetical protein
LRNTVLALLNGHTYDHHSKIEATEAFMESLKIAMRKFVSDPVGIPMMIGWMRVGTDIPDFQDRLNEALGLNNRS